MSLFSENLRHLREQKGISQSKLAESLIITRERLAKYEEGRSEPPLEIIKRISVYYHISIDILLSIDLKKTPIEELLKLGDNRILLPIAVDRNGDNFIEIIPHKAKAGYLSSYSDPVYIESLQHISLPFLRTGKFRAFPVEGDSMPPHYDGSYIIGRYVEELREVVEGRSYILLTRSEGIVYKRVRRTADPELLMLHSDNSLYAPYSISKFEVLELWEFACSIATKEFAPENLGSDSIQRMFIELQRSIDALSKKK